MCHWGSSWASSSRSLACVASARRQPAASSAIGATPAHFTCVWLRVQRTRRAARRSGADPYHRRVLGTASPAGGPSRLLVAPGGAPLRHEACIGALLEG